MQFLKFLTIGAILLLPSAAFAFPWELIIPPTITRCDSYPFPSCRARTLCKNGGHYWYAILASADSSYLLKDINSAWEDTASCQPVHGDPEEEYSIKAGDTGLYSFDLTADNQLKGRVFFMNAGVWFDMVGRKIH